MGDGLHRSVFLIEASETVPVSVVYLYFSLYCVVYLHCIDCIAQRLIESGKQERNKISGNQSPAAEANSKPNKIRNAQSASPDSEQID